MHSTNIRSIHPSDTSKRRDPPYTLNKNQISTEESSWKSLSVGLNPSNYQYSPLNVNLDQQKCPIATNPSVPHAKAETQTIAKSILLTLSQPTESNFQIQSFTSMNPDAYLKMAKKSFQRITPFHGEDVLLERELLPRVQIQKLLNPRRKTTDPNYQRSSSPPLKEPRRRFSQVAIITPSLKYPQLEEEGRGCGGKEWKQVYSSVKRQQQAIRKAVSLAVCQIAQQACTPPPADTVEMVIKSLLPGGGVRSHSLPMRMEGRVKDYIEASNKSIKPIGYHTPLRSKLNRVDLLLKARQAQRDRMEIQLSKLQRFDGSNLFRKLNAFRRKNPVFKRQPEGEEGNFQQKVLKFQSEQESERLHGQQNSKLTTRMGHRFTNTVILKNKQPSSRMLPPS